MSSLSLLDCLVLRVDDLNTCKLFILYDTKKKTYELRGKNYVLGSETDDLGSETDDLESVNDSISDSESESEKTKNTVFNPFSLKSKKSKHLIDFIEYIVSTNICEFTIYNYNNFPCNSNKITYDFLENHQDSKNEIFCYEKECIG